LASIFKFGAKILFFSVPHTIISIYENLSFWVLFLPATTSLATNGIGLGEVAASNTFSTRATPRKYTNICPREVMPPSCQTQVRGRRF